jgi:hypothetical protein
MRLNIRIYHYSTVFYTICASKKIKATEDMGLILFNVSYNKEINSTAAFLDAKTEHRKRGGGGGDSGPNNRHKNVSKTTPQKM